MTPSTGAITMHDVTLPGAVAPSYDFHVTCQAHVAVKLRRLFAGVQRRGVGEFRISATPSNAYELRWFMGMYPMDVHPDCRDQFQSLVALHEHRMAQLAEMKRPDYVPRTFTLALPARDYQCFAADMAIRSGRLLVADDLGVGKTVTAICVLAAQGRLPAAVVVPTNMQEQWRDQLAKFAPEMRAHIVRSGSSYPLDGVKIEVDGRGKRRRVAPRIPDVVILNYEKLTGWVDYLGSFIRTLVFDEIQALRHTGTGKYNAAKALSQAPQVQVRMGLSGTPIYNYGGEIFPVVDAIAPGALGTYGEFWQEWCGGTARGSDKIMVKDPVALGSYLRESGLMIRRTRREVGRELPPLNIVRHVVDVDHARIDEAVASVAEIARRVLARTGTVEERMRWSGEIDWRMRQATGIGKAPAVADFVRMLVEEGEPVLLFGWHKAVYSLWCSAFEKSGVSYALYTGDESRAQRRESMRRFKAGEARVLIMSLRSGSGIDGIQDVCRTVVLGELDWSPQVMYQDIGRSHRDGQLESVTAFFLEALSGSDPVIADVLGLKEAQATGIISPEMAGVAVPVGASTDHVRRLAEDILRRHPPPARGTRDQSESAAPDAGAAVECLGVGRFTSF